MFLRYLQTVSTWQRMPRRTAFTIIVAGVRRRVVESASVWYGYRAVSRIFAHAARKEPAHKESISAEFCGRIEEFL